MTYEAAIKCAILNGIATGERRAAGDMSKAASYDAAARQSFDLAYAAGRKLGLGNTRISADLAAAEAREVPKITASMAYYREVAVACKAVGLLG